MSMATHHRLTNPPHHHHHTTRVPLQMMYPVVTHLHPDEHLPVRAVLAMTDEHPPNREPKNPENPKYPEDDEPCCAFRNEPTRLGKGRLNSTATVSGMPPRMAPAAKWVAALSTTTVLVPTTRNKMPWRHSLQPTTRTAKRLDDEDGAIEGTLATSEMQMSTILTWNASNALKKLSTRS